MSRDDEIYELTKKDQRIFLPGSHRSRVSAVRVLLAKGWWASWVDRSEELRPRTGWVSIESTAGERVEDVGPDLAPALKVTDPSEAWRLLTDAPQLDPVFLGGLRDRLVERGPDFPRIPLAAPRTIAGALALAAAPKIMCAAEQLVKDAFARAAPFGVGPCPPIVWCSSPLYELKPQAYDRSAFSPMHKPLIEALGYGVWMGHSHPGRDMFSFARHGSDIPNTLDWAASDVGAALQIDAGRSQKVVTPSGLAYAEHDNPFELLLRVAYSGIMVEKVSPEQVVLVVSER